MKEKKKKSNYEFFEGGAFDIFDEDMIVTIVDNMDYKELARHIYWGSQLDNDENKFLIKAISFLSYLKTKNNNLKITFEKSIDYLIKSIKDLTLPEDIEQELLVEFTENILLVDFFIDQKKYQKAKKFFEEL